MAFRAPTLLNSMDLQCGHRVEKILTEGRIMALCPLSAHWLRQGWRVLAVALRKVHGDRFAGWSGHDSPPAPTFFVPEFSRQAPTVSPVL